MTLNTGMKIHDEFSFCLKVPLCVQKIVKFPKECVESVETYFQRLVFPYMILFALKLAMLITDWHTATNF